MQNMKRVNCDIMSTQNICVEAWIKFTAQKLSLNYHSTEIWNPFFQKSVQTAELHWKLHWMYFSMIIILFLKFISFKPFEIPTRIPYHSDNPQPTQIVLSYWSSQLHTEYPELQHKWQNRSCISFQALFLKSPVYFAWALHYVL